MPENRRGQPASATPRQGTRSRIMPRSDIAAGRHVEVLRSDVHHLQLAARQAIVGDAGGVESGEIVAGQTMIVSASTGPRLVSRRGGTALSTVVWRRKVRPKAPRPGRPPVSRWRGAILPSPHADFRARRQIHAPADRRHTRRVCPAQPASRSMTTARLSRRRRGVREAANARADDGNIIGLRLRQGIRMGDGQSTKVTAPPRAVAPRPPRE
jgi:hypothetical protein